MGTLVNYAKKRPICSMAYTNVIFKDSMNDYIATLEFLIENPNINTVNETTSKLDVHVVKELHDKDLIGAIDCSSKSGLSFLEPRINMNGKEWLASQKQQKITSSDNNEDIIDVKPNFMGIGINFNALFRKFIRK